MTYSDDESSSDNGDTSWTPSCDICYLLYSIKSTVESNASRLTQISTEVNKLMPILTANFDTAFTWDYKIKAQCSDTTNKEYKGTAKGLRALVDIQRDIAKILQDMQKASCENDNLAVIPEWWQLRPEADRPQLIVLCAEKKPDGTLDSAKYVSSHAKLIAYLPSLM
ncbi:hypothetical protein [Laspinema olomoucense]|uniref:Uncharacterized protein n=1 Tax=Laspinema olomoucense D3b TaxID=2953688 RepID=A0ABT2NG29_9CYAN|nr:hypothetical protein [Laspinema sp. D3b]MCT7981642.1 hypothetical protein [Laspinema sp. D3b]